MKDADGTYTLANKAAAAAHGVAVERLEGATHDEFALSDEQRDFKSDDAAVVENGESVHIEEDGLVEAEVACTCQTDIVPSNRVRREAAIVVARNYRTETAGGRLAVLNRVLRHISIRSHSWCSQRMNRERSSWQTKLRRLAEPATNWRGPSTPSRRTARGGRTDGLRPSRHRRRVEPKYISEEYAATTDESSGFYRRGTSPTTRSTHAADAVLGVSTDITELKQRESELEMQSAAWRHRWTASPSSATTVSTST